MIYILANLYKKFLFSYESFISNKWDEAFIIVV
ncbi:hypothetical protein CDSM653_01830 [Caldanaerobacter subterraneus subsp. pacificus DSM 12653]|uniref:Uncharacterized protein n=1 Tax=Caldanaerobacter subterraneus subsp. pacificus DSM 12653 TaxID=391606 RepID=A0A0F5PMZ0_9THEO|nr:hypothetical protein CDSM653_01830 [Caldanaerobacter subterraneus subsp. pacificus DSM 12653]